jgi:hypothetical protein
MHSRRIVAIAGIVALLIACHKMVTVRPGQYGSLKSGKRAMVITRDGRGYEYRSFYVDHGDFIGRDGRAIQAHRGPVPSRIPLDGISVLKVQELDAAKTALLAGGIAAGTIAIIVAATREKKPAPPPQTFSCPYVFSFDGKDYRFDSETYAGAIFAAAERTDYDNLDFLAPAGGQYHLRMRNERQETQYTNQLTLLVVDHPAGTRLVPDPRGALYALDHLKPPTAAVDYANRDILNLVTSQDGAFWQSDLSDGTFNGEKNFRDGVILTFRVPSRPTSAKLLIRAQNTALGPFALRSFLELQGQGLYRWYLKANSSPSVLSQMKHWFFRDGMLLVKLWERDRWVLQDALPDVGPALAKDVVAKLDLSRVEGSKVRIKLESSIGLSRIDAVILGLATDAPIQVTRLAPARDGRDIRHDLTKDDGRYYIALPGDSAEILFPAPPLKPHNDRSYVLKSEGFYYIYADSTGPTKAELADRILNEPGLAAQYFVPRWIASREKTSQ